MPVSLRSIPTGERSNFHQPAAGAAYGEQFKDIGIPAVAAAVAQLRRAATDEASAERDPAWHHPLFGSHDEDMHQA